MNTQQIKGISGILVLLLLVAGSGYGQVPLARYAEGKVFMTNGFTLEGKDLRITLENVTLNVLDQDQVIALADVVQIMAKRGQGKRYGRNCGLFAIGLNTLSYLGSGGKYEDENGVEQTTDPLSFIMGSVILGGLSYGIGYGVGLVTDHWEVVYLKRN